LSLLPFVPDQKTVAQHHQRSMAMEAMPQPPLILIPAQLILGVLMEPFDVVPPMRVFHQHC
jgi:hypothetical protein